MDIQMIRLSQIKSSDPATYNHFGQQVDGMNTPKVAQFLAVGGEEIIDVAARMGDTSRMYFNVGAHQLKVFVNGTLQIEGAAKGYIELTGADAGKKIQFNIPLASGDEVELRIEGVGSGYINGQEHQHVWREVPTPLPDGAVVEFSLTNIPHLDSEQVYLDGVYMRPGAGNDYYMNGNKIVFTRPSAPAVDSNIQVNYVR